jgi:hypothetical protein
VSQLISEDTYLAFNTVQQRKLKSALPTVRDEKHGAVVSELSVVLPLEQQCALMVAQAKRPSMLVTSLPIEKRGFALRKKMIFGINYVYMWRKFQCALRADMPARRFH